jgi:isopenicillin-N epimerase
MAQSTRSPFRPLWSIRDGVTYLNHGSFGPSPRTVLAARQHWLEQLESEPMDFFVRRLEEHLDHARERLGAFVGTAGKNLVFVENATYGMNLAARSIALAAEDEVVATDHEYGAVQRIWRQKCHGAGAALRLARLPDQFASSEEVVEALFAAVTPRTRLIVVSHVTSPTAVILPVAAICARARTLGIPVCVDGPHAPAAVDLNIDRMHCDYYAASCHKWMSAPFGSGFLYVHPRRQRSTLPVIVSWGQSLCGRPPDWADEFTWPGTRDPSAFLSIPAAIEFLESFPASSAGQEPASPGGIARFRAWSHALARGARARIVALTGIEPMIPDSPEWYGPMIALPLPNSVGPPVEGHMHPLQRALWERHQIEVPIVNWRDRRFVRVSCHLYNDAADIDILVAALGQVLGEESSR